MSIRKAAAAAAAAVVAAVSPSRSTRSGTQKKETPENKDDEKMEDVSTASPKTRKRKQVSSKEEEGKEATQEKGEAVDDSSTPTKKKKPRGGEKPAAAASPRRSSPRKKRGEEEKDTTTTEATASSPSPKEKGEAQEEETSDTATKDNVNNDKSSSSNNKRQREESATAKEEEKEDTETKKSSDEKRPRRQKKDDETTPTPRRSSPRKSKQEKPQQQEDDEAKAKEEEKEEAREKGSAASAAAVKDSTVADNSNNATTDEETTGPTTSKEDDNNDRPSVKKTDGESEKTGEEKKEGSTQQEENNTTTNPNKIIYERGTILSKYFPKSKHNPKPGWYKGTIKLHHVEKEDDFDDDDDEGNTNNVKITIWNEIHYEDGDIETLTQEEMKQEILDEHLKILQSEDDHKANAPAPKTLSKLFQKWLEKLEKLKKFKADTGHCRVPKKYETDPSLSSWVNSQRKYYKKATLQANRIAKLDEIGFDWVVREPHPDGKSHDQLWMEKFDRLKKFKEEKGHCRVPGKYDPDPSLGLWVNSQRRYYKKDTLAKDRIEKLKEIGFEWILREGNPDNADSPEARRWMEVYERLQQFKTKNGHCRVPSVYSADKALGIWVRMQRRRYKLETLQEYRIEKLNEIGFDWVIQTFQGAAAIATANAAAAVAAAIKKKTKTKKEDGEDDESSTPTPTDQTLAWPVMFEKLKNFKADNGHCRVPQNYSPDPALGGWVMMQRTQYNKMKDKNATSTPILAADQVEKLNEIGFDWGIRKKHIVNNPDGKTVQEKWNEKFERLKQFKEVNGHCRVPKIYDGDPALGKWVSSQRFYNNKGLLAADRIAKLNEIGFSWVLLKRHSNIHSKDGRIPDQFQKWDDVFGRLKKYKEENGHCRVPNRYATDPHLGQWVATQRKDFKKDKLSPERVQKLNDIGFAWVLQPPRERKPPQDWDEVWGRLKKFKEENGHCRVPAKYSPDQSLAHWVHRQRGAYKKGTLAPDCIQKLNEIDFPWDGKNNASTTTTPPVMKTPALASNTTGGTAAAAGKSSSTSAEITPPAPAPMNTTTTSGTEKGPSNYEQLAEFVIAGGAKTSASNPEKTTTNPTNTTELVITDGGETSTNNPPETTAVNAAAGDGKASSYTGDPGNNPTTNSAEPANTTSDGEKNPEKTTATEPVITDDGGNNTAAAVGVAGHGKTSNTDETEELLEV